ncbi:MULTISPECIES: ABC transporter substrate-binding protein [unclassified Corynebacterium]|uniref:ABC transporter substrate-binding protein n=1 Tax=unclassified Corynebacterium TaxID=2624378 RepID=UPI001EF5961F|nr:MULTISPECIES: ABC transporter substrate-binding protein [unclassified Corynebacterium]MCG7289976.1 ABC transporter substrate-binding protein [Corynebacterium sp. ACRPZ]MCG7294021.1 ABC transporter substrate-binding protein [Corynebacterium sp. ACRPY]
MHARSLVAAVALALPLAACGDAAPRDNVVVAASGAPAGLDFTTTGGAAAPQALVGNVYETLVRIDASGAPVPHLAERVERDGGTFTFHLRDGVTFANGKPFTADDAAFSIHYVQNEWTNGLKAQMDPVTDVEVVDERTLRVTVEGGTAAEDAWLWSMGTLTGAMMTPAGVDKLATAPLGTGPYTVARFDVGEAIEFDAREDYWGGDVARDGMIRYFDDPVSAVNALRVGDADVVWGMQAPQLIDTLPEDIRVEVGTTNGEVLLSMNNTRAPFDDPDVRRAVAYAVDRAAVNEVVYNGLATDTGGAPVPPTDPWYPGRDFYPFDPDKARELLAGRTPEITITVPNRPYAQEASELIYSQLRAVGFRVRLETVEFPAVWLNQVLKGHDYQASIVSHVEPRDVPMLFGNPDYYLGYDNAVVRERIAAGDMAGAVEQIMDDAAALTLANAPNIVLYAPGVSGLDPNVVTDSLPLNEVEK